MRYRWITVIVLAIAGLAAALALSASSASAATQSWYHASGLPAVSNSFYHG